MSDTSTVSSTPADEGSSNYTPPSYDIAPEDAELAESIRNFDPVYDVPGLFSVEGNPKLPDAITREMLPPEVRERVEARIEEVPVKSRTVDVERELIRQGAEQYAYEMRVRGGAGHDANPYQQEVFLIEQERLEASEKLMQLQFELLDVHGWNAVIDEQTGQKVSEADYCLKGDARTAAEHEVASLKHQLAVLDGLEGKRRLERALHETIRERKRLQEEVDIDREAQADAARQVRAARVADRAAAYRKFAETER